MTRRTARLALSAILVAVANVVPAGQLVALEAAQNNQRTVAVSVLGRNDLPVADLTVKDFTVREDGVVREVVRVSPAAPPATIALLIDDSQAAMPLIREIRNALTSFADIMADQSPVPAMRLATFGARPTTRVDFTPTFSAVSRGIDQITPSTGSGGTMLDAIIETCRDLRTRRLTGAVIVAFVAEAGPEFSTANHRQVHDALKSARASLWTIVLQDPDAGGGANGERRERALVTDSVTVESGGRNKVILSGQNLPKAFEDLAGVLLSRYEVTYGRPDTLIPPTRLEIAGRDRAWKVQVPRWPAE